MSRRNAFRLAVVDDDRRMFNVVGPLHDDTGFVDAVMEAQRLGRGVRCFTLGETSVPDDLVRQGYSLVRESVLR